MLLNTVIKNVDILIRLSHQTQDSWAETGRIPIYKRFNDLLTDSACVIMLQSGFTRHPFPHMKFGLSKYNGNVMARHTFELNMAIRIIL